MKIERVDDKTVKCFLSLEELEEYQLDYKDFVMRSEKAKEVVQEIIDLAAEEVGYKPPRFAFDLQIMMVPDQGMVLTFSEKDPPELSDQGSIAKCLEEMKKILQEAKENAGEIQGQPALSKGRSSADKKGSVPNITVMEFDSIGRVMEYASALPGNLRVTSVLYEMNHKFYLYINRNRASYERYTRACVQALEFGRLYAASQEQILFLEEHGECLIAQGALKKLSGR